MRRLILVAICLLTSGCALTAVENPGRWTPQASSTQSDLRTCRAYGRAHSPNNPLIAAELTRDCMELKGYKLK